MAGEAHLVGNPDAAQEQRPVGGEGMDVEAEAGAPARRGRTETLGRGEVGGEGELHVPFLAFHPRHRKSGRSGDHRIVGVTDSGGATMGRQDFGEPEPLRGLRPDEAGTVSLGDDQSFADALERVDDRQRRQGSGVSVQ